MILSITQTEYLIAVIGGALLFGLLAAFVFFFILMYRRTRVKLHWERERIKQELLRVENEVKEQTMISVSRELHDNFGQVAALIKINLNLLAKSVDEQHVGQVKESINLIQRLLADIKSLSASLNGERLRNIGWIQAFQDDVKRIAAMGEIKIVFQSNGDSNLSLEKQVVVYRVTQEILSNMLKHAKSSEVSVEIQCSESEITLDYRDNGVGFDENKVIPGQGLDNMRKRCDLIGAKISIESQPGTGTHIILKLPNHEE